MYCIILHTVCNFTHSVSFYTQFAPFCREVIFVRNLRCFVARRFSSQIYALLSVKFSDLKIVSVKKVTNIRYDLGGVRTATDLFFFLKKCNYETPY